ncbi:MAG TPA: hypothetical protein VFM82_10115 [Flavobacteriaceae bacterium]|nr:hypothetical protein [Flavobacteriaceae bacterium]
MKNSIHRLENENKFREFSSIFRIFIGLYLLRKVFFTWEFQELLVRGKYLSPQPASSILSLLHIDVNWFASNFEFFYLIYILLIFLFLFGIGKQLTVFFLYVFLEIIYDYNWLVLNGGDNLLEFVLLYFIFIDSYSRFSLKPLRYKNEKVARFSNFISNLAGYSICIHLCVAYFMSAIFKIHSDDWFHGVGMYYSVVAERFNGTSLNFLLVQSGLFVTVATYATIAIELAYPFLIWFKKTRHLMIVLAIMLHFGIAMFTMLYAFQFLFIFLQGFFITNNEWKRIFGILKNTFRWNKTRIRT